MRVEVTFAGDAHDAEAASIQVVEALKKLFTQGEKTGLALSEVKITTAQATETEVQGRRIQSSLQGIQREAKQTRRDLDQISFGGAAFGIRNFRTIGLTGLLGLGAAVSGPAGGAAGAGLAALPGLAAAGGAAIGVLVASFHGLGTAIEGDRQAFEALDPAAQKFVQTVRSLEPWLKQLQETARAGLLPGVDDALHSALSPANAAMIKQSVGGIAAALGDVAREWGKGIGSPAFTQGAGALLQHSATWMTELGDAAEHLAGSLGKVTVAAIPLDDWMVKSVDHGARLLDNWVLQKQASGELSGALDKMKGELKIVGAFGEELGKVVFSLSRALTPLGNEVLVDLTRELKNVSHWIDENRTGIRDFTTGALHGLEDVLGVILPLVWELAKDLKDVVDAIGGWENAFAIVIGGTLVVKLAGVATGIYGIVTAEEAATANAKLLRLALLGLGGAEVLGALAVAAAAIALLVDAHQSNPTKSVTPIPHTFGQGIEIDKSGQLVHVTRTAGRGPSATKRDPITVAAAAKLLGMSPEALQAQIGATTGSDPYGPQFGESSTLTKGVSGPITTGLKAIETLTGAHVNDDFATSGHATNSYHYKGEAADLAVDKAVWAKLYANKGAFAELFGPWGLYHKGVRFYDKTLQAQHMDHIHVAYTGGPQAITKMLTGSSGAGLAGSGSGGSSGASPFGAVPGFTGGTGGAILPASFRIAMAKAQVTTGTHKDDVTSIAAAIQWLKANIGTFTDEDAVQAWTELGSLNQQLAEAAKKAKKEGIPATVTGSFQYGPTTKSLNAGKASAKALVGLLGSDPEKTMLAGPGTVEAAEKHLAELRAKLGPAIKQIQRELNTTVLAKGTFDAVTAQMAQYKKAITKGLDGVKAALASEKSRFQDAWQGMAQVALDAVDDAAAKWKSPTRILLDQMESDHSDASLQSQLAAAQQQLADALTGKPDDSAIVQNIQAILGRTSLANMVDEVQSAILGGTASPVSGTSLLAQLQEAMLGSSAPDAAAVKAANEAVAEAKYQITVRGLDKTATAEETAHDQEVADLKEHISRLSKEWETYFGTLKGNIGGISAAWASMLKGMGLGDIAAAVANGSKDNPDDADLAAAAGLPIIGGVQWTPAMEVAQQAVELAQVKALTGAYGPKGPVQLHAAGGIATRAIYRNVIGEGGPEAMIPLNDPRAREMLGGGGVTVELHGDLAALEPYVTKVIRKSGRQLADVMGSRTSERQRTNRV